MQASPRSQEPLSTDAGGRLARLCFAAVVLAAPLPFGSVLGWSRTLVALLLGGLLVAVVVLPRPTRAWPHASRLAASGSALLAAPAVLQLVPLPPGLLRGVSPSTAAFLARNGVSGWHPLSQDPLATRDALLWLGACGAACFLTTAVFDRRSLRWLLGALTALAALEAFYGLAEFLSGRNHIFLFEKRYYTGSVTGTYINKNHFAGLLEMTLPVAAAWLAVRAPRRQSEGAGGLRSLLLAAGTESASRTLLLALALAVMLAGLTLSFSVAGMLLGLGAGAVASLLGARLRERSAAERGQVAVMGASILVLLGLTPLALRGAGQLLIVAGEIPDEMADVRGRPAVWSSTARMAADHPFFGTGLGTFGEILPRYRPASVRLVFTHAHQDLLQWVAETGVVGVLGLAGVLIGLVLAARRALRASNGTDAALAGGLIAGATALALHGMVDFNLHIPANSLIVAVLLGGVLVLADEPSAEILSPVPLPRPIPAVA